MDFSWLTNFLSDPNMLIGMGNAGEALSKGASFGEAFNPAGLLSQIQGQKATSALLKQMFGNWDALNTGTPVANIMKSILGGGTDTTVDESETLGSSNISSFKNPQSYFQNIQPTPKGQPGPDAVTENRTADGTTMTIKSPSATNLSTYGTSVPLETMKGGSQQGQSPFWKTLFNL